jgi:hypothetical protein
VFYYRSFALTSLSRSQIFSPEAAADANAKERENGTDWEFRARGRSKLMCFKLFICTGAPDKNLEIRLRERVSSWLILTFAKLKVRVYNSQTGSILQ